MQRLKNEEEYERQRVQELEENYQKYNQYIDEILNGPEKGGGRDDKNQQDSRPLVMPGMGGPNIPDEGYFKKSQESADTDYTSQQPLNSGQDYFQN